MKGVAVKDLDAAGGKQLGGGQGFFKVDGNLVIVKGDNVKPHGPAPHGPKPPIMIEGSNFVTINGTPICLEGHKASCGHPTSGQSWVMVSG